MKPNLLLPFLLLFLQVKWSMAAGSMATDHSSHGAKDQVHQLPQLSEDQPLQDLNVSVELSSDDKSRGKNMGFDGEKWANYSKKSGSGGTGGRAAGGAGAQALRQPRSQKSSSTSLPQPYYSLSRIGLLALLLWLAF